MFGSIWFYDIASHRRIDFNGVTHRALTLKTSDLTRRNSEELQSLNR